MRFTLGGKCGGLGLSGAPSGALAASASMPDSATSPNPEPRRAIASRRLSTGGNSRKLFISVHKTEFVRAEQHLRILAPNLAVAAAILPCRAKETQPGLELVAGRLAGEQRSGTLR